MPEIEILTAQRVVTAAGTPEKIKEAPEDQENRVIKLMVISNHDNVGLLYVVNGANRAAASTVGVKLPPNSVVVMDVSQWMDAWLDLSKIWVDAANSGDGLSYIAFKEV